MNETVNISVGPRIKRAVRATLFRFQIRGVRFLEQRNGRAIIGDDMGLGKTMTALTWMAIHPELRPAVIICPSSVKYHWQRELWNHARIPSVVLSGQTPSRGMLYEDIVILNYDILRFWSDTLKAFTPKVLVLDEFQRVKNRQAKRSRASTVLAQGMPHILALSGTPIISRPVEFFPVLQMIEPDEFKSFWAYAFRYCAPKRGFRGRGWDFSGASNTNELHQKVSKLMIRRMKSDVLADLPAKTRSVIPVDISNRKEYEKARDNFIQWLASKKGNDAALRASRAEAVVRLGALKHLAAEGKIEDAIDSINEWMEDTDRKLVVFAIHHSIINQLVEAFPSAAVVTGAVGTAERSKAVDRFQLDPACRLFFGNMQAAGEGITLHAASDMLILELGWTPAEHDQTEDRINRIGQTADHVHIRYMVAKNTVEEDVMALIDSKRDVVGQVIDGRSVSTVQMTVIDRLLNGAKNV